MTAIFVIEFHSLREGAGVWSARKLRHADEGRAEITPRLLTGDGGYAQLRRREEAPARGRRQPPAANQINSQTALPTASVVAGFPAGLRSAVTWPLAKTFSIP